MHPWDDWCATGKILRKGGVSEDRRDHYASLFRPVSFGLETGLEKSIGIVVLAKYNDVFPPFWLQVGLFLDCC